MRITSITAALIISLTISFGSCMPDTDEPENSNSNIGFNDANNVANKLTVNSGAGSQLIYGPIINLNSTSTATSEIHVQLAVDNSIVTAYNAANGTNYIIPATNLYNISGLTVTILPGQSSGRLAISIPDPNLFSTSSNYGLGFRIISVDGGYLVDDALRTVPIFIKRI